MFRRGESMDATTMERNVKLAAEALAPIARNHRLVVTHGNGPQTGLLALQGAAYPSVAPYPLDMLGAETEGMIGYLLCRELRNCLGGKEVVTVLTQTVVPDRGTAYMHADKFVGPSYEQAVAEAIANERGWRFRRDGENFRRAVPSPAPSRILELPTIAQLIDSNTLVVCAGGGGIPVTIDADGLFQGVEAVVDKDLAAAWLASELQADILLFLTDVDGIYRDWGTPRQQRFEWTSVEELEGYRFEQGSMGSKVEGACRFLRAGGSLAAVGALDDADRMLEGAAGTRIRRAI